MKTIIVFIISGQAFFIGNILLILSIIFSFYTGRGQEKSKRKSHLLFQVLFRITFYSGIILYAVSGTVLPVVLIMALGMAIISFWLLSQRKNRKNRLWLNISRIIIVGICLSGILSETQYCEFPRLPNVKRDEIHVFGDSLSGGIGKKGEITWSDLIREKGVKITNHSVGGAGIKGFLTNAGKLKVKNALIIVELGGNDMFRKVPYNEFYRNLDGLLSKLKSDDRTIMMFELPTPPWQCDYFQIQRDLAKKYGVYLVPRRFLSKLVFNKEYTVDGLHLSNAGHKFMAEEIWKLVKNSVK